MNSIGSGILGEDTAGIGQSFSTSPNQPTPVGGGPTGWTGMLVIGMIFLLIGIVQLVIGSSIASDSQFSGMTDMKGPAFAIGGATMLIGLVLIGLSFYTKSSEASAAQQLEAALKQSQMDRQRHEEEQRQEMVKAIRSTIRVRCRYCGSLNDEHATKCESCGAGL